MPSWSYSSITLFEQCFTHTGLGVVTSGIDLALAALLESTNGLARPDHRLVIDFGFRKPSVLILAHDPTLEADVICAEINPQENF